MIGGRIKLPNRREAVTEDLIWADKAWPLSAGFDCKGRAREVFIKGHKAGSDAEALIDDACVLASRLLQHGESASALAASLSREGALGGDPAASILGAALRRVAAIEAEVKVIMRELDKP